MISFKFGWRHSRILFEGPVEDGLGVESSIIEEIEDAAVSIGRIQKKVFRFLDTIAVHKIEKINAQGLIDDLREVS